MDIMDTRAHLAKPNLGFKYYCGWDLLFALHLVKILGAGYSARLQQCPIEWRLYGE